MGQRRRSTALGRRWGVGRGVRVGGEDEPGGEGGLIWKSEMVQEA